MLPETRFLCCSSKIWISALLGCTAFLLTGCGTTSGSGSITPTPGQAVAISIQPLSQTVPIGEAATFTVTATGTAPLSYQWSENGAEIPGATGASYTTPPVALGGNDSTSIGSFKVTVSNTVNSVASSAATLTAGPRSPKAGDLRYLLFQQVSLPGLGQGGGLHTDVLVANTDSSTNSVGTPLQLGSSAECVPDVEYDCGWFFEVWGLPPGMTGLTMGYQGGFYSNFASDMQSIVASNLVLTALDFEPANGAYAISWAQTAQAGGFDYRLEVVPPAQIQAAATQDGTESRVITAASFDASGNANLVSYGWTGDTATKYEVQTVVSVAGDVANEATILASAGYVISACGGNDTDGYMLIGTRVQGDSLPRPITVAQTENVLTSNPDPPYFTTVVYFDGTFINEQ